MILDSSCETIRDYGIALQPPAAEGLFHSFKCINISSEPLVLLPLVVVSFNGYVRVAQVINVHVVVVVVIVFGL